MASERRATTATSGEPLPPYLPSLLCDLHAPEDDGYGTTFQRVPPLLGVILGYPKDPIPQLVVEISAR